MPLALDFKSSVHCRNSSLLHRGIWNFGLAARGNCAGEQKENGEKAFLTVFYVALWLTAGFSVRRTMLPPQTTSEKRCHMHSKCTKYSSLLPHIHLSTQQLHFQLHLQLALGTSTQVTNVFMGIRPHTMKGSFAIGTFIGVSAKEITLRLR